MTFLKKFFPSLMLLVIISCLSLLNVHSPKSITSLQIPHLDKIVHFCMYFGLSFIFLFDWSRSHEKGKVVTRVLISCILIATLMGALMEFCQGAFTKVRASDPYDMLANTLGAITGGIVGKLIIPKVLTFLPKCFIHKS